MKHTRISRRKERLSMTWSPKWTATVSQLLLPPSAHASGHSLSCCCSTFSLFPPLSVAKKIDELQEILRKKDEDMKQMEERYKRYVEKARTVRTCSPQSVVLKITV